MWHALVDDASGALLGAQTAPLAPGEGQVVIVFEADRPDQGEQYIDPRDEQSYWTGADWDPIQRTYVPRGAPSFQDRAVALRQRIRTELASDPDFLTVWNGLSASRKNLLVASLDRVITNNLQRALRFMDRWMRQTEQIDLEG